MTDQVAPSATGGKPARQEVRLAEVTADNWQDVAALELEESQTDLVASNLYSLAEAKFTPLARPRSIYAGAELVGFMMYDLPDEDQPDRAMIYRFMIDRRHQHRGYGRAALQLLFAELRTHPGINAVAICYAAKNPARTLYESVGFKELKRDAHGEIFAELSLTK